MNWKSPFVVYRIESDGKLKAVHVAHNLKDAKYWLTYIAEPGDVLCRTPVHPRHSKSGETPEYWGHKVASGATSTDQSQWLSLAEQQNCDGSFPADPSVEVDK